MDLLASNFQNWQKSHFEIVSVALVICSALIIVCLQAVSGLATGLEALYGVPVWLAFRLSGKRVGVASILAVSLLLTAVKHHGSSASALSDFSLHLLGFSVLGGLIVVLEKSYSQIHGMAFHDPLTGLLNRNGLLELAKPLFQRKKQNVVVVMLDCDGFKQVNDCYGHSAGDHILKMLARILEHETRVSDSLVRIGGDEFALILEMKNSIEAKRVLERVQAIFELQVADAGYDCSISFGIAEPENEDDLEETLCRADEAMYINKRSKQQPSVY